jgi:hypothetical protein
MMRGLVLAAATSASLGLSSAALSATVDWTITCTSSGKVCDNFFDNGTITFTLPQFPTPDRFPPGGHSFILNTVSGTVNGVSIPFTNVQFFQAPSPSVFFTYSLPGQGAVTRDFIGTQLWQGTLGAPQFVAGEFSQRILLNGSFANLEVSASLEIGSPVPEPSTWTAMISGLCMLGIVRWRRSVIAVSATLDRVSRALKWAGSFANWGPRSASR